MQVLWMVRLLFLVQLVMLAAVIVLVLSALILYVAGIVWLFGWAVYKKPACLKLEQLELARAYVCLMCDWLC